MSEPRKINMGAARQDGAVPERTVYHAGTSSAQNASRTGYPAQTGAAPSRPIHTAQGSVRAASASQDPYAHQRLAQQRAAEEFQRQRTGTTGQFPRQSEQYSAEELQQNPQQMAQQYSAQQEQEQQRLAHEYMQRRLEQQQAAQRRATLQSSTPNNSAMPHSATTQSGTQRRLNTPQQSSSSRRIVRQPSTTHTAQPSVQRTAEAFGQGNGQRQQMPVQRTAEAFGQGNGQRQQMPVQRTAEAFGQGNGQRQQMPVPHAPASGRKMYDVTADENFEQVRRQRPAHTTQPQHPMQPQQMRQPAAQQQPQQPQRAPTHPTQTQTAQARMLYDFDDDDDDEDEYETPRARRAAAVAEKKARAERARQEKSRPSHSGSNRNSSHTSGGGSGHGGKKPTAAGGKGGKKKAKWWKILLVTLLCLVLIFGGTIAIIMHAIAPKYGAASIGQLLNTPKEYAGDYLNVLVCGVDWDSERADMYSDSANDGMTDMIMYVHMDFVENKVYMLQIPRNTLVTDNAAISGNFQINGVARTQGESGSNNNNYAALIQVINEQWQLPVDGYVSINMQSFREIVDTLGGIEVMVPHAVDNNKGSRLEAGYQTLTGEMAEFLVRNRYGEGYANSDLDRLNMQRYVYSGLFRRLKTMTAWDVAKMMPLFVKYCESSLSASDIVSLGVSMLKIDSSNMMMCQMPVFLGTPEYYGNSVVVAARQEDADLLNTYFRGTMGAVDASQLGNCFDLVSTAGLTASDPNIQQMRSLNNEAAEAQQNDNIDGSATVTYVDPTPVPAAEGTENAGG